MSDRLTEADKKFIRHSVIALVVIAIWCIHTALNFYFFGVQGVLYTPHRLAFLITGLICIMAILYKMKQGTNNIQKRQ